MWQKIKNNKHEIFYSTVEITCAAVFGYTLTRVTRPDRWEFWALFIVFFAYHFSMAQRMTIWHRKSLHDIVDHIFNDVIEVLKEKEPTSKPKKHVRK
jgi:hypothetical protein